MADQAVGELIRATGIGPTDLFLLEQAGVAKSLTGQILMNWLVSFADGHGGIHNIAPLKTVGLVTTFRITLADETTFDFDVKNGNGVKDIQKVNTQGLVDTYAIKYDEGEDDFFTVTNGKKGDPGRNSYTHRKYASQKPTEESHSIGDVPDRWVGLCESDNPTPPTDWKRYEWYEWKGEKGDPGDPARLVMQEVKYQVGDSGSIIPSGNWQSAIPVVPQGKYLWLRGSITFNSGSPITFYVPAHQGLDGSGSVSSVSGISPDPQGNVPLSASDVGALPTTGGEMTGPIEMNGQPISGLNPPKTGTEPVTKYDGDRRYLQLSGGTMDGPLTVMQPTASGHAARKQDVDNAVLTAKTYTDDKITWLSATLPTAWSGAGPYTQRVVVPGIPSNAKSVTCWPEWAADAATREKQREAWSAVSRIVPSAGAIAFTCDDDKPVTAVPMRIEVQL